MVKRGVVVLIGVFVALLGLSDVGQTQPPASVQVQGTIRSVDCYAQSVTLDSGGGTGVYRAAGAATIRVNSLTVPVCALQQYLGAPATIWLTASGNELLITRMDVAAQTYAPPATYAPAPYPTTYPEPYPATYPAPYPYPAAVPAYGPPPLVGIVLGTVIVAGLVYLLVRHPSGALFRYPYYGHYYRHYYRPVYQPYYGPLRYAPAYVYGPYRWCPYNRAWGYWCR